MGRKLWVKEEGEELVIADENYVPITRHSLSHQKGQKIINSNHLRDMSKDLAEYQQKIVAAFPANLQAIASVWIESMIQVLSTRFIRDHFKKIDQLLLIYKDTVIETSLEFCLQKGLYKSKDFENVCQYYDLEQSKVENKTQNQHISLYGHQQSLGVVTKSEIGTYQNLCS